MIHVGIDLHTRNMTLVAINDNSEEIAFASKVKANKHELERFFSSIEEPTQAVIECTSNWYWVDDWFRQQVIPLVLAHCKMLKAISYSKVKTDSVDARMLAKLLKNGLVPQAWKTEKKQRELRELTRSRLVWIRKRVTLQARLTSLAGRYNVNIEPGDWKNHPGLYKLLRSHLPMEAWLDAEITLDMISNIQQSIMKIEQAIDRQIWYTEELRMLMKIPGIGKVSAWTILAEIGDIKRFPSHKQFVSYCRLVPGSNDSAGKRKHKSGCKDGNKYLKTAFYACGYRSLFKLQHCSEVSCQVQETPAGIGSSNNCCQRNCEYCLACVVEE